VYDGFPVITRRRLHLVLTLLLPLLTLRALLPTGYMVSAAQDGPRIVMCSAGLLAWHAAADDARHQHPAAAEDCLFAHAAVSAPPPHYVIGAAIAAPAMQFVAQVSKGLPPATGPPRQTSARAPPFIS
jgi:hypothetical protein